MNLNTKPIFARLLQQRLDGHLREPTDVLTIVQCLQPYSGLTNQEWDDICAFIMQIEKADNIPAAKKIAEEYELNLEL